MKIKNIIISLILIFILTNNIFSKRLAPKEVKPLVYKNIKFTVPHWGKSVDRNQNGGFIEAWDLQNNKQLWFSKIYTIKYGNI